MKEWHNPSQGRHSEERGSQVNFSKFIWTQSWVKIKFRIMQKYFPLKTRHLLQVIYKIIHQKVKFQWFSEGKLCATRLINQRAFWNWKKAICFFRKAITKEVITEHMSFQRCSVIHSINIYWPFTCARYCSRLWGHNSELCFHRAYIPALPNGRIITEVSHRLQETQTMLNR